MLALAVLHLICLQPEHPNPPDVIKLIADSGRCMNVAESPDTRTRNLPQIAPGQPPMLTFRLYEGKMHHRFGNADLMLDDAGH
jgi:hypothetical protein